MKADGTGESSPACEHDYAFIAEGIYDGSRPGFTYDEFFCRRCLDVVAVERGTGRQHRNLDPTWFRRTKRHA